MSPKLQVAGTLVEGAVQASRRATEHLLGTQAEQGYWWAELTADTTLESDYILLQLWLHPPVNGVWNPPTRSLIDKAAKSILARQLPDGGFNIYPQGTTDLNATVKAYFSLKLAGLDYNDLRLTRARERILALKMTRAPSGTSLNSSTKIAPACRNSSTTWRLCTISLRTYTGAPYRFRTILTTSMARTTPAQNPRGRRRMIFFMGLPLRSSPMRPIIPAKWRVTQMVTVC